VTAGDLLTISELQDLRRRSARRGAWLVLHAWAVVAGAALLYTVWPSALTFMVAVVVIGGRQLGLAVLMHEASHWLLFPGQSANNRVGSWLCAAPIWTDLPTYRRRHHLHHRHTQQPDDPLRNARTTTAGVLERALLAPYWANHHLEHHLMVFVSCWRLREAHALLLAKGHGPRMEVVPGYVDVIRRATTVGAR